jgi:putative copper resistance protein D
MHAKHLVGQRRNLVENNLMLVSLASASGIPEVSPYVTFFLPIVKDLNIFAAITVVGLLLATSFLIREKSGVLGEEALRIKSLTSLATGIWLVTIMGQIFLELTNLLAEPLVNSFDPTTLRSFLSQSALGRSYLISFLAAAVVLALLPWIKKTGGALIALIVTFVGVLAPIFQSHSSGAGNHGLAIGSLLFHVLFISLWVGGVIGLAAIKPAEREASITRFSSLALWCAIIVSVSGIANAWTRLNFLSAWTSFYAILVILKVLLTAVLIGIGVKHRRYISAKLHGSRALFQLLTGEILVMAMTVAIGGWLSTTQPPIRAGVAASSPVLYLTGLEMPAAPTLSRILWLYVPDGAFLGLLLLATALYIRGVVVLTRRGDKWPVGRTVSFAIGIALADFATSGGLGVYAHFAFSFHMIAHMLLGMIAPIAFVLSAPITLALRTLPQGRGDGERGIRGLLLSFIHSRYAIFITNPISALLIFDGSLFALYMTPLFGKLMQSHSGHLFMDIHFLAAGFLFFHVIVGIDPNPRKVPHLVRIVILFAAMSIHAFFSIALMAATTQLDGGYFASLHRPWLTDLLNDQHTAGSIGWAMGEIPILVALVATFIQWVRDDSREGKRLDRAAARSDAMGTKDELSEYNEYLASLARRDGEK